MIKDHEEFQVLALNLGTSEPILKAIIERVGGCLTSVLAEWQEPLHQNATLARAIQIAIEDYNEDRRRLVWGIGNDIAPPRGAIGFKYECSYEDEQWIFSEDHLREIAYDDPNLVIRLPKRV